MEVNYQTINGTRFRLRGNSLDLCSYIKDDRALFEFLQKQVTRKRATFKNWDIATDEEAFIIRALRFYQSCKKTR